MFHVIRDAVVERLREAVVDPGIDARIDTLPNNLSESGYDAWGFHPEWAKWSLSVVRHAYERYFRVETHGMENVPDGRVLLIANHGGQLPLDGMMVAASLALERTPPRAVRAQVEKWFPTLPVLSTFFARNGQVVGTQNNCARLLENDEAVLVFPEGIRGSGKLYRRRYQLQEFGLGFMRLALRTGTPIVPVGVVGAEETYPALLNLARVAKLFGAPYLPVTPTFPLLGLLGLVPLPTRIRIYFDEPIRFDGDPDDPDDVLQEKVDIVRAAINKLVHYGLESRPGLFD